MICAVWFVKFSLLGPKEPVPDSYLIATVTKSLKEAVVDPTWVQLTIAIKI